LIPFIKIELKIFNGSYKQKEIEHITKKQAAIATDDILSFKQMNKAIKNLEIEKMSKCMIQGYDQGEKEAKVSYKVADFLVTVHQIFVQK